MSALQPLLPKVARACACVQLDSTLSIFAAHPSAPHAPRCREESLFKSVRAIACLPTPRRAHHLLPPPSLLRLPASPPALPPPVLLLRSLASPSASPPPVCACVQGYKHGRDDALSSLEDEIKRTARTAYAQLVLEEEARRAAELGAAVTQLERVRPRCVVVTAAVRLLCSPARRSRHRGASRALVATRSTPPPSLPPPHHHRPCSTAAARAGECVAEEDAVVACTPDGGNEYCAAPVRAYVLCADRVLFRMMNPISAAAAAAKQDK